MAPLGIGIGLRDFEELEVAGMGVSDLTKLNPRPLFAGGAKYPTMVSISPGGYYARGGSHVLDSYTGDPGWTNPPVAALAAGRVEEYGDFCGAAQHPDIEAPLGIGDHFLIDLWFAQDGIRQGALAPNCMCGFGVGSVLATPPNVLTAGVGPPLPAAPSVPSIQVQLRHSAGQDDIYLYTAVGDGVTAAVATKLDLGQDSGVTGLQAQYNYPHRVQLEYNAALAIVTFRCTDTFDQKIRTITRSFTPFRGFATGFYLFAYTGTGSATGQQVSFGPGTHYIFNSGWGF